MGSEGGMTKSEMDTRIKAFGDSPRIMVKGTMAVAIRVVDAAFQYGQIRYKVEPIAGEGSTCVDEKTVFRGMPEARR